jgi:hypothetical protein
MNVTLYNAKTRGNGRNLKERIDNRCSQRLVLRCCDSVKFKGSDVIFLTVEQERSLYNRK